MLKAVAAAAAGGRSGRAGPRPGRGRRPAGPLPITSSRMGHLWDALCRAYDGCSGSTRPPAGTRCSGTWCWPGSSSRPASWTRCGCWTRSGSTRPSYRTLKRRLPVYAERRRGGERWRRRAPRTPRWGRRRWCSTTCRRCTSRPTPGDGFREPGFSKERRLEPQITIGLLTDATGFPLMVQAFEGNKAETKTMLPGHHRVHGRPPARRRHRGRRRRDDLGGQPATRSRTPGCRSSSARRSPTCPTWSTQWRKTHPGAGDPRRARCSPSRWPAGPNDKAGGTDGHLLPVQGRPGPAHPARDR